MHRRKVAVVISELVSNGMKLSEISSPANAAHHLSAFEALHVLYVLAKGIAPIHARGEYHGDIHDDNIMIRRQGIGFEGQATSISSIWRKPSSRPRSRKMCSTSSKFFWNSSAGDRLIHASRRSSGILSADKKTRSSFIASAARGIFSGISKPCSGTDFTHVRYPA